MLLRESVLLYHSGIRFCTCKQPLLVTNDIRATVFNESLAIELSRVAQELSRPAYVHIKVDTGWED